MGKCLLKLYEMQESHEQYARQTIDNNAVGFNTSDSSFLTKMAEKLKSDQPLTNEEWGEVSQKLRKYSRQLATYPEITKLLE